MFACTACDGWPDRKQLNPAAEAIRVFLSRSQAPADYLRPATGNYVVVWSCQCAALLAHLWKGSIRVSEGEAVHQGQGIGEVSNSDPLTAEIVPFKGHRYERWIGSSWQEVQEGAIRKEDRIHYSGL